MTNVLEQKMKSTLSQLPKQQFQGTDTGLKNLVSSLKSNPKVFADTVEALRANPRGVITHLLALSGAQIQCLGQMSDSELNKTLEPMLSLPDDTDWSKAEIGMTETYSKAKKSLTLKVTLLEYHA